MTTREQMQTCLKNFWETLEAMGTGQTLIRAETICPDLAEKAQKSLDTLDHYYIDVLNGNLTYEAWKAYLTTTVLVNWISVIKAVNE